ncbi:hypothetical protein ZIOFF_027500 [Zingiber officinale]|uniref:Uncharacterized protein n=1 Tax=Zingiber officinale TaxID=94328 RepID=A0A8J5GK16_ZINOF|nr:hypothetical protein ZIOFF_027500 [Zingiber officinale]
MQLTLLRPSRPTRRRWHRRRRATRRWLLRISSRLRSRQAAVEMDSGKDVVLHCVAAAFLICASEKDWNLMSYSDEIATRFRRDRARNPTRLDPLAAETSSQLDGGQAAAAGIHAAIPDGFTPWPIVWGGPGDRGRRRWANGQRLGEEAR